MPDGRHLVPVERLWELAALARDGVDEDALFEISCREFLAILEHIDTLTQALEVEDIRFCRVCGCTYHNPCEGGCGWADEDLCTACANDDEAGSPTCPGGPDDQAGCAVGEDGCVACPAWAGPEDGEDDIPW